MSRKNDLPLPIMSTSDNPLTARLRADVAQTGFWEGRELRVMFDINGAPACVKVELPVNATLQSQDMNGVSGLVKFRAYNSSQGVEGGTFTVDDPNLVVLKNNNQTDAPPHTQLSTISAGGTFTPNAGEKPRDRFTVSAATATAQRQNVGAGASRERGVAPETYYLIFDNPNGNTGVAEYNLIIEERP